jgi:hypothetical protein
MKSSRRSFLEAGLALLAVPQRIPSFADAARAAEASSVKDSSFGWKFTGAIRGTNVQEISRRAERRPILAVVKKQRLRHQVIAG